MPPVVRKCSAISRRVGPRHTQQLLGKRKAITLSIPFFLLLLPALDTEKHAIQHEMNTPAVPAMSDHNCLCICSFLITGLGRGAEKVQVLLRNNQSIPVLPALLPKQIQTQPHASYCEENKLSENQHTDLSCNLGTLSLIGMEQHSSTTTTHYILF